MNLFNPHLSKDDLDWFHSRYTKLGEFECWPWNYYRMKTGHGQIRIGGIIYYAHQIQYFLLYGPYDASLIIRHNCGNGWCCNPLHYLLGTRTDNMKDKVERERQHKGSFLLTDKEVFDIHQMYSEGKTQQLIAKKYNLAQAFISRVISGKRLRHQSEKLGITFAK